ncbi:Transthyretin-like family protein [Dictyocaulus viviparus]|uniref:Transthyretin-like family protein n=1 Tax=Dictyocaulus viviparus TaxID=29172 RepID=A0A0D8XVS5_DICVI|nr:Transthyretin-like family protein [Dictyocaulus viviparus]
MKVLVITVLLLSTAVIYSDALLGIGRTQSVAVTGRLLCNGQPASNVKVKLYEKEALFDKKLDEGVTNRNGEFQLSGHKTEITTIDPKVNVYHKCNYHGICYKKFGITIPDNYVSSGQTPRRTFDIGTINLANKFTGETTDCIN